MLASYVVADLVRNPRRTLSTMVGVVLGVGLFCGVLFFIDGLSASMTQRAVAPLPLDMQRIVTERVGGTIVLSQTFQTPGALPPGARSRVRLELRNTSDVAANEVTLRSQPGRDIGFIAGSAEVDGTRITGFTDNPFAHGPGKTGYNVGTVGPGATRRITFLVQAGTGGAVLTDATVRTSYSSREAVTPTAANEPPLVALDGLVGTISAIDGVAWAAQLSLGDLGADALSSGPTTSPGPTKVFGFDAAYAAHDDTIKIVEGAVTPRGAVLSAEAASSLGVHVGDTATVRLPDASSVEVKVSGIADLSRARSLFSSRRGGDLETFAYARNSIVVSPEVFGTTVLPAYERAATTRGSRLKSPPVREIDVRLERHLLDSDPARAVAETQRIGTAITSVANHQDYLLDNISNTLTVAAADARVAKRLFVFLGVPGGFLAAMLAAYAGTLLAEAQRRERATLRIRGASRRHLLVMLAFRTAILTGIGSAIGLAVGYLAAATILGRGSLDRASPSSLFTSALIGSIGGFIATGLALHLTGRRSIDREINEDRARLVQRPPLWRRAMLDIVGLVVIAIGTVLALGVGAFDGAPGSVYFGRAVHLDLPLLVLPVAVWIAGSLLAARAFGSLLRRTQPHTKPALGRPLPALFRLSVGRRPWAISNGAVMVSLIVGLATSLAAFTASYDSAKVLDARYANGSDIRITPGPTAHRTYTIADGNRFTTAGVAGVTPVIYGRQNVILRSGRTSDPANLAAIDPADYPRIAPVSDADFGSGTAADAMAALATDPRAVFLSRDMAAFLKAKPGDSLFVLLARATAEQTDVEFRVKGLFERLPGFPDGADALMAIEQHAAQVPTKAPDFFLAAASGGGDAGLERAVSALERGPAASDSLHIDTRRTTLARDQSSLAALNIAGLVALDSSFALSMAVVTAAVFVFGLLLQRRREYITLRAQGLEPRTIRLLIGAEAGTVTLAGTLAGLLVGVAMGYYFVTVLRPLFVLTPRYVLPWGTAGILAALVLVATIVSAVAGSRLVNGLQPTELLRDE